MRGRARVRDLDGLADHAVLVRREHLAEYLKQASPVKIVTQENTNQKTKIGSQN